jgi:Flp pilus assembly pilin Flp
VEKPEVVMVPVSKVAYREQRSQWRVRASRCWLALRRLPGDQVGQTLAEYALILSLVAAVVVSLSLFAFRDSITSAFSSAGNCIQATCSETSDAGANDHCNDGYGQDGNQAGCN